MASLDKDFIVAILAVQLGHTRPQKVMSAAVAWLADRSTSIPQRLVDQGVVTVEQCKELETMADGLLDEGGDAGVILETLAAPASKKHSEADATLPLSTMGRVPQALDSEDVTQEHDGRYIYSTINREESEIGRGGLGKVLVAFDEHLGRKIAIKELLGEVSASADSLARFFREARVTAQLEHPNIIPVYELGRRGDACPQYKKAHVAGLRCCFFSRWRVDGFIGHG